REFLGDGQAAGDDKLLDTLRGAVAALRADDPATLRDTHIPKLAKNLASLLEVRARNGARTNRLDSALSRLSEVEESTVKQLSQTEDIDIAESLLDFYS